MHSDVGVSVTTCAGFVLLAWNIENVLNAWPDPRRWEPAPGLRQSVDPYGTGEDEVGGVPVVILKQHVGVSGNCVDCGDSGDLG